MKDNIWRLARVILLGFGAIAVALFYWQLVRASTLVVREDNPRLVQAELRLRRGRLLDRNGQPLAYSAVMASEESPTDLVQRHYLYSETTHIVGYYSPRYGTAGAEDAFDAILRGELTPMEYVLHRPQSGQDAMLSVNLDAQRVADQMLTGRQGAVVVIDIDTGEVPVLVSHPAFDPNTLDDDWDSLTQDPTTPLLNRATQGLYPVGDLSRWIGIIGLLSSGATVPVDPSTAGLDEVLAPLSQQGYVATARQLGFDQVAEFELPGSAGLLPDFTGKGTPRDLAVTPLHMARVMAAVAGDGRMPVPSIAPVSFREFSDRAFSPSVASSARALSVDWGQVSGWAGTALPEETGDQPLSWFVGYGPSGDPRFALAIVVEADGRGANVTAEMAEKVLQALESGLED